MSRFTKIVFSKELGRVILPSNFHVNVAVDFFFFFFFAFFNHKYMISPHIFLVNVHIMYIKLKVRGPKIQTYSSIGITVLRKETEVICTHQSKNFLIC